MLYGPGDTTDTLLGKEMAQFHAVDHGKLPHFDHKCDTDCCHGTQQVWGQGICDGLPLGAAYNSKPRMVVIDGNQNLRSHCCAEPGCTNIPANTSNRFCDVHHALETKCAFCMTSDPVLFCTGDVVQGGKFCAQHQAAEQEYGQPMRFRRVQERTTGMHCSLNLVLCA